MWTARLIPEYVVRVYLADGSCDDKDAIDFYQDEHGLTLIEETPEGGRQQLAVYPAGVFLKAERVPWGAPLPRSGAPPDEGRPPIGFRL